MSFSRVTGVITLVLSISFSATASPRGGGRGGPPDWVDGRHPPRGDHHRRPPERAWKKQIRFRPALSAQPDEIQAVASLQAATAGLQCERLGESIRRLSNQLRSGLRGPSEGNRRKWKGHFRSRLFWESLWNRMAEAYRSCEVDCFDDGAAIGEISALGYCTASVELGGLTSPGFLPQEKLPLCENAIFVGCQQGYLSAAASFEGCSAYSTGVYASIFQQSISQDCHLDSATP